MKRHYPSLPKNEANKTKIVGKYLGAKISISNRLQHQEMFYNVLVEFIIRPSSCHHHWSHATSFQGLTYTYHCYHRKITVMTWEQSFHVSQREFSCKPMPLMPRSSTHGNLTAVNSHYILQTAVFQVCNEHQHLRNNTAYLGMNLATTTTHKKIP